MNLHDELLEEVAKNPEIQILDRETAEVFNTLSGANIEINEKEGAVNMCKAFEELRRRGISEGEAIGQQKTAFNLRNMGMEEGFIAKAVGVTEAVVRKWFAEGQKVAML